MKYRDALKELQYDRSQKFVLTGEEAYLKEHFINAAKQKHADVDHFCFFPGDEEEIKDILSSSSLFGDRLVLLRNYDEMKDFSELVKKFEGLLIVVLSDEANLKLAKATKIIGCCTHAQCSKMGEFGRDYPTWIVSKAEEKKFLFLDGAEDTLYKMVGPDMFDLSQEIFKLMLYKDATKTITPEDVEKVVGRMASYSMYDLLDNLLRKDVKKALVCFDSYAQNNDSFGELIWFLGHYLEKMYRIILMSEKKISPESMADILHIPTFIIKTKYIPRCISFGKAKLLECMERLCAVEVSSRTFQSEERILIENYIFSFGS
jgi:DNA polymerase III delta subunit